MKINIKIKTKDWYVIALVFFSLFFLSFIVSAFFFSFGLIVPATSIVSISVGGCLLLLLVNPPKDKINKFIDYEPIQEITRFVGMKYTYHAPEDPYFCAEAVIQMICEKHSIKMTQKEITVMIGDKKFGTTAEEIRDVLNRIFIERKKSFKARVSYKTDYSQLHDAIYKKHDSIVMFINHFSEKHYSSNANYPHFGLLNYIKMSKNKEKHKAIVTSPAFGKEGHNNFARGRHEGEIVIPFYEFQDRFYFAGKYLRKLSLKPTRTPNFLVNCWNRFLNLLFIFACNMAYSITALKPGTVIFVEPSNKK